MKRIQRKTITGCFFLIIVLGISWTHAQESPVSAGQESGAEEMQMETPSEEIMVQQLILNQGKIEQAVAQIKMQTGVDILVKGRAAGQRLDLIVQNEPLETVLKKICEPRKWVYNKIDEMTYEIMDEQTWMTTELPKQAQRKTFQLKYIKATEAQKAIQGMLTKGIGASAVDERTNKLFVTDLPQVLEVVNRLLDEIDVRLVTRVFYIKHALVRDIVSKIEVYKSPPGIIESDEKTHQIIVTDTFENIKRMEMLIDVLDIGPEIKTYDINNLGAEGKLASEIEEAIKEVITEGAFWKLDVNTGKLIVEDMPEVHIKIQKILDALDTPLKQVLIEAELIETSLENTFEYSVNYQYSSNNLVIGDETLANRLDYKDPFNIVRAGGVGFSLDYLSKRLLAFINATVNSGKSKVLLQPRLIVRNGEKANIFVGGREPYLTTYFEDSNNTYWGRSFTQNYVTVGLTLDITPTISNRGLIEMKIKISNKSAQVVTRQAEGKDYSLIKTFDQDAETVLIVPSGETRVIGGLVKNEASDNRGGVPILSQIPYLGPFLFGSKKTRDQKRDVLFFVTPTIVEEEGRLVKIANGILVEEGPEVEEEMGVEDMITSPAMELDRYGYSEEYTSPTLEAELISQPLSELPELTDLFKETERENAMVPLPGAPSGTFGEAITTDISGQPPEEGMPPDEALEPGKETGEGERDRERPIPPPRTTRPTPETETEY